MKLTHIQVLKTMHEARTNMWQRLCSLFWHITCSGIHTTKYSGGHDIFGTM